MLQYDLKQVLRRLFDSGFVFLHLALILKNIVLLREMEEVFAHLEKE